MKIATPVEQIRNCMRGERAGELRVKVSYVSSCICSELDEVMVEGLAALGFERYASGYDLTKDRRDLCFELKS